jgi:hypothetical protein
LREVRRTVFSQKKSPPENSEKNLSIEKRIAGTRRAELSSLIPVVIVVRRLRIAVIPVIPLRVRVLRRGIGRRRDGLVPLTRILTRRGGPFNLRGRGQTKERY